MDIDYTTECKYQPWQCKKTAVKNWKIERAGGRRPREESINILTSQESSKRGGGTWRKEIVRDTVSGRGSKEEKRSEHSKVIKVTNKAS